MARAAQTSKTTKSPAPARGRKTAGMTSAATKVDAKKSGATKVTRSPALLKRNGGQASTELKNSREELLTRVEKLERANTALRARSRETERIAKEALERLETVEDQLTKLKRTSTEKAAPRKASKKQPAPSAGGRRRVHDIDPGDAVPPGVAVAEAEPLDEAAEIARVNLEEHLSGE